MEPALIAFGAAIIGALIGGFAAAVGSWALSRAEHVREQRVRMLADHIPTFTAALRQGRRHANPMTSAVTAEVVTEANALAHRAASTRGEVGYGHRIIQALADRDTALMDRGPADAHGNRNIPDSARAVAHQAEGELIQVVFELEMHLLKRLSGKVTDKPAKVGV